MCGQRTYGSKNTPIVRSEIADILGVQLHFGGNLEVFRRVNVVIAGSGALAKYFEMLLEV